MATDPNTAVAKILNSPDGRRRVLIVQRSDGRFGLAEEKRYRNVYEGNLVAEGWMRLSAPTAIFATVEIAEREAKDHFPWLAPADSTPDMQGGRDE